MIFIKYVDNKYDEHICMDGNGDNVVLRLLKYITDDNKTYGIYVGHRGFPVFDINAIEKQFYATQILYNKFNGDKLIHMIISFSPEPEIIEETAMGIGNLIADIIGREYQLVFGVHVNSLNPHIHFIINPVSYINGKIYRANTTNIKYYGMAIKGYMKSIDPYVSIDGCIYMV